MLMLLEFDIIRVVSLFSCGAVIFRTLAAIIILSYIVILLYCYIVILRTVIKHSNANYTDSSVSFCLEIIITTNSRECFHHYRIDNNRHHY